MKEKDILLKEIDDAITNEKTSSKNKELLKKVRPQLVNAKSEKEYSDVVLKIIQIIGAIVKIFTGSG